MRTHLTRYVIALVLALTSLAAAQDPPSPPPQSLPSPPQSPRPTPTPRPTARGSEGLVTLEGCLVHDSDVEARVPKIREPIGVSDDYVLTRAKVVKGSAPESLTGTYDVDDLDPGLLASHVGQRVQIDGWFDELDRAANPAGRRGSQGDLVEIRGSAIRTISKDCQD
jgi:hypothetical protein